MSKIIMFISCAMSAAATFCFAVLGELAFLTVNVDSYQGAFLFSSTLIVSTAIMVIITTIAVASSSLLRITIIGDKEPKNPHIIRIITYIMAVMCGIINALLDNSNMLYLIPTFMIFVLIVMNFIDGCFEFVTVNKER